LRHAVELALEHPDDLDEVLEHHLRETARAVRSRLYGTAELVPPPELPTIPAASVEPIVEPSPVTPLASSRVRKTAHGFRSPLLRELFLRSIRAGYQWQRTGGGHVVIHAPGGPVSLSITAYDGPANARIIAVARRAGVDVTGL